MRKTLVSSRAIVLGNKGENNVNKVLFPVRGWKELYGEGTFGLIHQRPSDNDPYPCSVTLNGYFVEWIIGAADVDQIGVGRCELRYMVGGTRVKSVVYDTIIRDSLGSNSIEPPDPWESWIDDLEQLAADIEATTETAFNTKMAEISADATTLPYSQPATASYDNANKKFHFGIPQGVPGSGGGGGDGVFWAVQGVTPFNDIKTAYLAGMPVMARDTYGGIYLLIDRFVDEFHDVFVFTQAHGASVYGENGITELTVNSSNQWANVSNTLENSGVITVEGSSYAVQRKALAITENGVTTTYYVADITSGVY